MIRSLGSDPNMQCLQVDFISNNWSVAPVTVDTTLNGVYTQTGATFSQKVPTTIDSLSSRATWNMNINGSKCGTDCCIIWSSDLVVTNLKYYIFVFAAQSVYSVLDTDYSTYSLSVTCATVNGIDDLVAFFKTRSHDPIPSNIVDNYKTYLRSYGINTDLYFDIVHGHACH